MRLIDADALLKNYIGGNILTARTDYAQGARDIIEDIIDAPTVELEQKKGKWEEEKTMWAIRNKRTRKWVYGTDYRYWPRHQRTSEDKALIFESDEEAQYEMKHRRCGKDYEVVPVRLEVVE